MYQLSHDKDLVRREKTNYTTVSPSQRMGTPIVAM